MKPERTILIAFLLNLTFAAFEFAGGAVIGSVAVVSDALHDLGDAAAIGVSWLLARKSKNGPDERHPFGYARYDLLGGALTTLILLLGSVMVIRTAVGRMTAPTEIHYDGMILFALVGVAVNGCAARLTHGSGSHNGRAVNLHMLEDVLGWGVVLAGAVVMRFTGFVLLDPILSVGVAGFILANALGNLREIVEILLEKTPRGLEPKEVRERIHSVEGVLAVERLCIWSLDEQSRCAVVRVAAEGEHRQIREGIREVLREYGVIHAALEFEADGEEPPLPAPASVRCHHHHHHP